MTAFAAEARLAEMTRELNTYCDQHGLPHDSADELLAELYGEEPRREVLCRWMQAFVRDWETVEALRGNRAS
jgi:hypothetical protein